MIVVEYHESSCRFMTMTDDDVRRAQTVERGTFLALKSSRTQ